MVCEQRLEFPVQRLIALAGVIQESAALLRRAGQRCVV